MQIRFNPNIDQTITVSPSLIASHSPSYAVVRFTAEIQHGEYEQINKGGARIQLWANSSSGAGSPEWQEHDFTDDKLHVGKLQVEVSARRLSLYLRAALPPSVEELQFSYTYRVLYQDGRVEWLGRFGQNGTCVVHRPSSAAVLSDQWHSDDDGVAYHLDVHGLSTSPLPLLSGVDSGRFNLYAINSEGAIGYTEECSLLFIAPKYYPDSHALPQAFSISSSPGNSISFSPTGTVYVNEMAKTSLLLQAYDIQTDFLCAVESVIAHSIPAKVRILYFDLQNGFLVLATTSDHRFPVRLAAIGLFPETDTRTVEVELKSRDFKKLSVGATTGVCIYPGFSSGISTIVWDRTSTVERVSLRPGIQYTLSPEYCMRSGGDLWRISILSDHADIKASLHQPEVSPLPTPPPPETYALKEGANSTIGEVRRIKSVAKSVVGLFGRYMRYCFSVLIMPVAIFFRILSVFKGVTSRWKSHGREKGSVAPSTANRMDPKRKKDHRATQPTSTGETVVGQESTGSARDRLCKSLSARVFPGLLTILLRSEADAGTDDAANILHMKLGDERWDGFIERKDERTFLLTTFVEKERNFEITPA